MPRKSDSIPINNEKLDRRKKLTEAQKEEIRKSDLSLRKLAEMYDVSKRTIQYIKDPEKKRQNLLRRKERGGWLQYYNKEKHTKAIKEHRDYKKKLMDDGLLQTNKKPIT
jgi:hypothetical protein